MVKADAELSGKMLKNSLKIWHRARPRRWNQTRHQTRLQRRKQIRLQRRRHCRTLLRPHISAYEAELVNVVDNPAADEKRAQDGADGEYERDKEVGFDDVYETVKKDVKKS